MPMSEHVSRLVAARMQWDIMGLETLLIARTDAESAKLISSTADARDHEFVLGVELHEGEKSGLSEELARAERGGKSGKEIDEIEARWMDGVELVTFDEGGSQSSLILSSAFTDISHTVQPLSVTSSAPSPPRTPAPSTRPTFPRLPTPT